MKNLDDYAREWTCNAEEDALWAILSAPGRRGRGWAIEPFFATGDEEIDRLWRFMDRRGIKIPHGRFLDFGCGVGRVSRALAKRFASGLGVDIAAPMIERAREYVAGVDFVINRKPDLDSIPDCSADFIYCHLVLQHMPAPYQQSYIAEFFRILKPQGLAVFQCATRYHPRSGLRARVQTVKNLLKRWIPFLVLWRRRMPSRRIVEMHIFDPHLVDDLCTAYGCSVEEVVATNSTESNHCGRIEFYDYAAHAHELERMGREAFLSALFFVRKDAGRSDLD